jgi:hypothetical protein
MRTHESSPYKSISDHCPFAILPLITYLVFKHPHNYAGIVFFIPAKNCQKSSPGAAIVAQNINRSLQMPALTNAC